MKGDPNQHIYAKALELAPKIDYRTPNAEPKFNTVFKLGETVFYKNGFGTDTFRCLAKIGGLMGFETADRGRTFWLVALDKFGDACDVKKGVLYADESQVSQLKYEVGEMGHVLGVPVEILDIKVKVLQVGYLVRYLVEEDEELEWVYDKDFD